MLTSPSPRSYASRLTVATVVAGLLTLSSCGGSSAATKSTTGSAIAATTTPVAGTTVASTTAKPSVSTKATTAAATLPAKVIDAAKKLAEVDPSYDICGRIPSMDAIATEIGMEFTLAKPDIDPLGDAWKCDVTGNSTTAVLFERLAIEPGTALIAAMRSGGQVVDFKDPALASPIAYVNTIAVEQKGYIFTVTIVDPSTKLNDPALLTHAGRLLDAWLTKL